MHVVQAPNCFVWLVHSFEPNIIDVADNKTENIDDNGDEMIGQRHQHTMKHDLIDSIFGSIDTYQHYSDEIICK